MRNRWRRSARRRAICCERASTPSAKKGAGIASGIEGLVIEPSRVTAPSLLIAIRSMRRWLRRKPSGIACTGINWTRRTKGFSVEFTRVVDMINVLTTAQINGTLEKKLRHYTTPQLLLLDELGYLPIDKRGADLLFQVVAARYERGSIVVSTNRAFRDWGAIFDVDNTLATAMIDRLMHHGEAIVIRGDSYRMKDKPTE